MTLEEIEQWRGFFMRTVNLSEPRMLAINSLCDLAKLGLEALIRTGENT